MSRVPDNCPKCGSVNIDMQATDYIGYMPVEYDGKCEDCGELLHWAYGSFEP